MRPLWDRAGQAGAELEALQTDVMRFMAILGLCLAAIFSLLRSAEVEPVNPEAAEVEPVLEPAPVPPPSPEPGRAEEARKAIESVRSTPLPPVPAPPAKPRQEEGFTLEFESSLAMSRLLDGGLVNIYLIDGDSFYSYGAETGFSAVDAPASYYAMQAETVPERLRNMAVGILPGKPPAWGVSLPATTERQLGELMAVNRSGGLVIDGEGAVRIE